MKVIKAYRSRTQKIFDRTDLVAVRIESTGEYLIKKCRWGQFKEGDRVKAERFAASLHAFAVPMVLSDSYIEEEG